MKKIIAIALFIVLIFSLCSCVALNTNDERTTPQEESEESEKEHGGSYHPSVHLIPMGGHYSPMVF